MALLLTVGAVAAVFTLARSGTSTRVPVTEPVPPVLASPDFEATPTGFVDHFASSLNAGDVDGVLASLDPEVRVLYFPGVAGIENPTIPEVRAAFERYRVLDATLTIDECSPVPAPDLTVLDCVVTYNSNFSRGIGVRNPHLFMRFVVGPSGIDATYLSPFVVQEEEPSVDG